MSKKIIQTKNAPAAIGAYSQAVTVNKTIYLSGQIPLNPAGGMLISTDFRIQARQVFKNLEQVLAAAAANLTDLVKLTVYLTDLANFNIFNEVMSEFIAPPFPARAAIGVKELPKGALIEADGIAVLD